MLDPQTSVLFFASWRLCSKGQTAAFGLLICGYFFFIKCKTNLYFPSQNVCWLSTVQLWFQHIAFTSALIRSRLHISFCYTHTSAAAARLYLTWPFAWRMCLFSLNPRTIVWRLWKKNRICRRGAKWLNLSYKLQPGCLRKWRLSFWGHRRLDHVMVWINRNGADRAALGLLLINGITERDRRD